MSGGVRVRVFSVPFIAMMLMASLLVAVNDPAAMAEVVDDSRNWSEGTIPEPSPQALDGDQSSVQNLGAQAPVAEAGDRQTLPEGSLVQLDGSGSADPNLGISQPTHRETTLPGGTSIEVAIDGLGAAGLSGRSAVGEGASSPESAIVYIVDVSGSANDQGGCGGDQNGDGLLNRIIDCEIAAVLALHDDVIASGAVREVGLVSFATTATTHDLDPTSAVRRLVPPTADADGNGVIDLVQVIRTLRATGNTNYYNAASAACNLLNTATAPIRIAVFMSDGAPTTSTPVGNILPCANAVFYSFAVGTGASCNGGPVNNRLQTIADRTGGTCTNVVNVADLPDILPDVITARLSRLEMSINGGAPIDITTSAVPTLPADGPLSVDYTVELPDLGDGAHDVCVRAFGSDFGGAGSVETCTVVRLGDAPLSYEWSLIEANGPPITLSSTTDPSPTFQAPDNGSYTFELQVTNGYGLVDSDRVRIDIVNETPTLDLASSGGVAGGVTLVSASFTDPGYLDTHTATVDWGDGTVDEFAVGVQGPGWGSFVGSHIYDTPGAYDIVATLTDDDGGSDVVALDTVHVTTPSALWAGSTNRSRALDWSGDTGHIQGRVHSNNDFRVTGGVKRIDGPATYVSSYTPGTRLTATPPVSRGGVEAPPVTYDIADYRPDGAAAVALGADYHDMTSLCRNGTWHERLPTVLQPGVYYADCNVQLMGSTIAGTITLVAEGTIRIAGTRASYAPYHDGLLFLSNSTGSAITMGADNFATRYFGNIYADRGDIRINGATNRFYCGVIGDRVAIAGAATYMEPGDCAPRSPDNFAPLAMAQLDLTLTGAPADVRPGDQIDYQIVAENSGSLLVVPGIMGFENLDSTRVTLDSFTYLLEYRSATTDEWVPFAAYADGAPARDDLIEIDLNAQSNPRGSVTFASSGLAGTTVDAGGFATWGVQAVAALDADTVTMLHDPSRVAGIRHRVEYGLTPVVRPRASGLRRRPRLHRCAPHPGKRHHRR